MSITDGFIIIFALILWCGIMLLMFRVMRDLAKGRRIRAQIMRCLDAGRSGDRELWERERQKMLDLLKDL